MGKKKRVVRFRIQPKKQYEFNFDKALSNIARQYTRYAQELAPLIRKDNMPPNEAIVLVVMYTDAMITGKTKDHWMTEEEILSRANFLMGLWKNGLFSPGSAYPYTLEQTLSYFQQDEEG